MLAATDTNMFSQIQLDVLQHGQRQDDIDLRLRHNNLGFLGLLKSVPQRDLLVLCQQELLSALGITHPCKVERAHSLGPDLRANKQPTSSPSKRGCTGPRQTIVKYLYHTHKTNILRSFKRLKDNQILRGHSLHVCSDLGILFPDICDTCAHLPAYFSKSI